MQESPGTSVTRRLWIKAAAAAVAAAIALTGYFSFFGSETAPNVTFRDLQGRQFDSASLRGKVVMVNFWATSCTTCVKEMPQMVDTYNKYNSRGLEFVAVAMNYDPPHYVMNYAQTRKLPFPVALDTQGDLAKSFGNVQMTPTTFVIGKDGRILKRYLGEPDWDGLHKLLEKSLT